jgi:hypothetical protein
MKYAAFSSGNTWLFNIDGDSPEEALSAAKKIDPNTDHVSLVSDVVPEPHGRG